MFRLIHTFVIPKEENNFLPKALHPKNLGFLSMAIVGLKLTLILALFLTYPSQAFFSSVTSTAIIEFTNAQRVASGLDILNTNERLNRAAEQKLRDMLNRQYFSHTSPDGEKAWPLIVENQYNYSYAGENLAMNFYSAEEVVGAWMASNKHKENILSDNFSDIGVAVGTGNIHGKPVNLVVQLFGLEYASPIQEFRRTVTEAIDVGVGVTAVMGESQQVEVNASKRSWIGWVLGRFREAMVLIGSMLSLIILASAFYESKHHHRCLAYGLFTLGIILLVMTLNSHFLEGISGSIQLG